MGARRRIGFVRSSDEEDEGSGAAIGVEGAGPSSSSVVQKRKKRSISQAAFEPHSTAGKTKKYKRLKHTVESKAIELDSDSDDDDYEYEDIIGAALRQRKFGRKEDRGFMKKNGKASSKLSPCKKRKKSYFSAQKTHGSKAGGIQFEESAEESPQQQTAEAVQQPLGKEFEQYLLEEVFDISKDTYTKEIDLPERFQIHEQYVSAYLSKGDWSKEAYWIYDRAFGNSAIISQEEELKAIADIDKEEIVQEIIFVLMQLHVQKCEIPFIGMYNFHGCMHLARRNGSSVTSFNFEENNMQLKSFKALWWIFHWDRKWLLLQHHIDKQQETWKKRAVVKESDFVSKDGTLDMLIQALQDAESELVVDDLVAKFNLQFPTDEVAPPKGQYKRPKRQSYYDLCCKSGLRQLVKQLGLTPEQLGENLQAMQKIHEALDCDLPPEDTDLSCASGQFTEVHHALAGARHMAAYEISCEPRVRNYVRSLFSEHAVLSTRSTEKGKILIDASHEFACVKYVQEKSVKKFDDGEWLIIQRAEEEQILEVTIELTQEVFDGVVMQGLQELYFSNGSNEVAVLWNEQRKLTLQEAVSKMILPLLIKEIRMSLTATAKAWVQSECIKNLWKRASVAPYLAADASPDDYLSSKATTNDATDARVLACCWGSRNPPTTFVMLDIFGELIDTLQTGYLNLYSGSLDQQLQRKTDDQERLQNFIVKHQPHVVVVGATVHYACRQLKDTITETVARAAQLNTSLCSVPVIFGDESLPSLYEKSQVSNTQLPKQPSIIRRAVALGRSLQNPLALIASLCNPSKDIVALNMHPMQRFLSTEELYSAIEQAMITVTNQVWVDVNLAVAHEWLFSPLQFICGLGWKKASMLQQLIQGIRWLPSRGHLLRHPFSLKDVVFRNCSGFLRIRRVAHAVSGLRKLDPLDDTRIHPESYDLARNLANYALSKGQDLLDSEADLYMAETAIVHVQRDPNTLTEETVTDFFNSLQEMEQVNIETLKDIRSELLHGYRDYRAPYTQPTPDEEFSWLTGEDDISLATGKAVNVTVHKVFRHRIMCVLESGIRGVLEKENFTSDSSVDLTNFFSEGSSLTCCIDNVMKDQFLVNLTCKEVEGHTSDVSPVQEMLSSDKAIENLCSKDYIFKPRDVYHSHFDNVSVSDAIKALSDKNPGEVVFHPSSRGPACLSMTLKCHDNVYLRKEIEELEKDHTNLATFSKLGRILKIGGRTFQNLDEVISSYASPLMGKMNEVLQLKEFQSGSDGEIKSFLHQEKGVSSESLVYCFSMCPDNPGAIAVSYVVDGNIKQETVDLNPEGYGFQNKMFRKIDTVVNYLKKPVLYDPQICGGRGEDGDGTGRGRGRGGRFGSERRGRGRDGRGGRGNGSRGKWGDDNKDGVNSFVDAQEDAQEGGTFSGGWGGKDDWSHSQNNDGGNNRGSFRGRRGRGRGYGRGGDGGQWGQASSKNEENFWSGGTSRKEDMDPLKASDTGAGNNSWDAGNVGNEGWGTGTDGSGSTEGGTFSGGWGGKDHSQNNDGGNNRGRGERGSFRGRRGRGRGYGRGGDGGQWGQASSKNEENFWSGGTGRKEDIDPLKASDTGAGNNNWDAGNVGNEGWGTGNDGSGSMGCHVDEDNKKDFSSWGAEHNSKSSSEEKGNEWVCNGDAEKHIEDNKPNGLDGWGMATEPPDTVSKDMELAKDSHNGWDAVEKAASTSAGNDGWGSTGGQMDEHNKKNEKDSSSWSAERNSKISSEGKENGWAQDGNAEKHLQDNKSNGLEGCGEPLGTVAKDVEDAKDSFNGWDAVEKPSLQASTSAGNVGDDGRGSIGCHMDELKKNNKDLGGWGAECNSSPKRGNELAQDGNGNGGGLLGKGPTVGGWGDDDSQEKHRSGDMGWAAQKGQNNGDGLLGKARTVGGWGNDENEKDLSSWGAERNSSEERGNEWAHGGNGNGGGLLGKGPTVGGWGDDDSQEKHRNGDMGWAAQEGQNNGGGLLGKAGGWGDDDSQEKGIIGGLGWGAQKEQSTGGWGGSHGLEEKWPKDNNQQQTQNVGEGYNARGSFRGGRGRSRGMGRGGRGSWFQGEGGMGRGGRGRWSQGEDGMGRGNRGRWSQNEGDAGGGRGGWPQSQGDGAGRRGRGGWPPQSQGDGAGRRGRGGRGRWMGADSMGRGGRGNWAQKQGEGANDNAWSGDGWNRDGGQWGQASSKNEENFWSGGTGRKEDIDPLKASDTGDGNNNWDAGNVGNEGWGTGNEDNKKDFSSWGAEHNSKSSSEEKGNEWVCNGDAEKHIQDNKSNGLDGWGMATEPPDPVSKDMELAKDSHNGWDAVEKADSTSAGNVGNDGWGTGNDGWGSTGGQMDEHNKKNEKDSSSWSAEHNSKISSEGKGNGWVQDGNADKHLQDNKSNGLEGWARNHKDGWASSSSEVKTVGWGDTLNNSGKTTKETSAQNHKDGWATRTQSSDCANNNSSKVEVTSEKSSEWVADDSGWKSSGHANDCLNVDRGWDAHKEIDVSHSSGLQSDTKSAQKECSDSIQIRECAEPLTEQTAPMESEPLCKELNSEESTWAEPLTQQTAPMESEALCKELKSKEGTWAEPLTQQTALMESETLSKELNSKESTEERGDGIWGACEDLIDSKEMEGLISRKGSFDNALESKNLNDELQGQADVLRGLEDVGITDQII